MLFCTVQDVEDLLQVDCEDGYVLRAIREATAAIKNYCRQEIELVEDDSIVLDVGERKSRLILPELPVVSVSSVVENDVTLTAGEDYELGLHGILYRTSRFYWYSGIQTVEVTYTHGYTLSGLPEDFRTICTRAAGRVYQSGLKSSETAGVLGINAKSLGDFSVQYGSEQGGGAGEGIMGVSGARILLYSEKDLLDKYRV